MSVVDDGSGEIVEIVVWKDGSRPPGSMIGPQANLTGVKLHSTVKVKGTISEFRGVKQLNPRIVVPLRGTRDEVTAWHELIKFRKEVLARPWMVDERIVRKAKRRHEVPWTAERRKRQRKAQNAVAEHKATVSQKSARKGAGSEERTKDATAGDNSRGRQRAAHAIASGATEPLITSFIETGATKKHELQQLPEVGDERARVVASKQAQQLSHRRQPALKRLHTVHLEGFSEETPEHALVQEHYQKALQPENYHLSTHPGVQNGISSPPMNEVRHAQLIVSPLLASKNPELQPRQRHYRKYAAEYIEEFGLGCEAKPLRTGAEAETQPRQNPKPMPVQQPPEFVEAAADVLQYTSRKRRIRTIIAPIGFTSTYARSLLEADRAKTTARSARVTDSDAPQASQFTINDCRQPQIIQPPPQNMGISKDAVTTIQIPRSTNVAQSFRGRRREGPSTIATPNSLIPLNAVPPLEPPLRLKPAQLAQATHFSPRTLKKAIFAHLRAANPLGLTIPSLRSTPAIESHARSVVEVTNPPADSMKVYTLLLQTLKSMVGEGWLLPPRRNGEAYLVVGEAALGEGIRHMLKAARNRKHPEVKIRDVWRAVQERGGQWKGVGKAVVEEVLRGVVESESDRQAQRPQWKEVKGAWVLERGGN